MTVDESQKPEGCMLKLIISLFAVSLAACGSPSATSYSSSDSSTSSTGTTPSTTPDTYEAGKDSDKTLQDQQNEKAYQELRSSGLSQSDAAEAVNSIREMCPHSDADGSCD